MTDIPSPHPTFLTAKEVARRLRCTPATIQRYAREGLLRARKVGRSYLFSRHDLEAFLAAR